MRSSAISHSYASPSACSIVSERSLPNIDFSRTGFVANHLRRHPRGRSIERHDATAVVIQLLARTEIRYLQDEILGDENIGRFQVAVNNLVRMEILNTIGHLFGPVEHFSELRRRIRLATLLQDIVQRTMRTVVHNNVEKRASDGHA